MLRNLQLRLRGLFKRRQLERDLQDELAYHMEQRGQTARAPFGNQTLVRENLRDMWTFTKLEDLWRDLRYSARVLRRAPGHTIAIIALLAAGIGSNAAIFTVFNAVFLQQLPVERPEELVLLNQVNPTNGNPRFWSVPRFEAFGSRPTTLAGVIALGPFSNLTSADVRLDPGAEALATVNGSVVSGNYFQVLGVRADRGRVFAADDDQREDPQAVVVLGRAFSRRLGGDSDMIGRKLYMGAQAFTVVGITPEKFVGVTAVHEDFWIPLNSVSLIQPGNLRGNPGFTPLRLMGRLKPGVSIVQAQAELDVAYPQFLVEQRVPQRPGDSLSLRLAPGNQGDGGFKNGFGRPLQVLMGGVGLLLLLACANVGGLLLARAGSRQREIAVRLALGCGRFRLIRQFSVESLILAVFGGAIGLALAPSGGRSLIAMAEARVALALDVSPSGPVVIFTLAISLGAAVLFGLAPAWRATRSAAGPRSRQLLNRCFVAAQVAFSVVLVAGSVLFGQSLYRLYTTDAGFNRENVISGTVNTGSQQRFRTDAESRDYYALLGRRLTESISALPGVKSISIANCGMLGGCNNGWRVIVEGGQNPEPAGDIRLNVNLVSSNFFDTLGIPITSGRGFGAEDRMGAPEVAVVNQTFAQTYFPGQSAIGKRFGFRDQRPIEIVGVVKDSKYNDLREAPMPYAFVPFDQYPLPFSFVQLKVDGSSAALLPAVRRAILKIDPNLRPNLQTLDDVLDRRISLDILLARLSALFGALALILACFGVYGVTSYLVVSRTNEIGIRLAVGAQSGNVLRQVIGDALKTVMPGVGVGIVVAVATERFVRSLLFAVPDRDPWTYAAVAVILLLTTALAAYWPARRASRIDPVEALRCE